MIMSLNILGAMITFISQQAFLPPFPDLDIDFFEETFLLAAFILDIMPDLVLNMGIVLFFIEQLVKRLLLG